MWKSDGMTLTRLAAGSAAGVLCLAGLTGCIGTGDGDNPDSAADCLPGDEAMQAAKERIDATSGIDATVHTDDTSEAMYVADASVTIVRPESFEGTFTGGMGSLTGDGDVIGIGDTVWARLPPLIRDWEVLDPEEYPIPNLGRLVADEGGLSEVLLLSEGLGEPRVERDEGDTSKVFCYYDGTLPSAAIGQIIPSAAGDDFTVEYATDGAGTLQKITLSGDPYGRDEEMTYVIDITAYDVDKDIQPPI